MTLTDVDLMQIAGYLFACYAVGFSGGFIHRAFVQISEKL